MGRRSWKRPHSAGKLHVDCRKVVVKNEVHIYYAYIRPKRLRRDCYTFEVRLSLNGKSSRRRYRCRLGSLLHFTGEPKGWTRPFMRLEINTRSNQDMRIQI